jgi:aspartyl-tRNA(Asn)/glutamyl-tRNA(Gln) amidotransferase subunit A
MTPGAVGDAFEALERWQPVTNAFTQFYPEDAQAELEGAIESGGPLAGVPIAVKDLFDIAGKETTGASRVYQGNIARTDAELVRRIRAAGAVIIGKTNMHELAMGGTNLLSSFGRACNPWDPSRITGGSSGGSAAAVASGVVRMALGTDTGGSIRNPAVLCGCWGLKPTHGRLPLDGVLPLAPSLDCPGPMTMTAAELETLWDVMAAAAPSPSHPARQAPADVHGLRVGLLGGHFARRVHPDIREAVAATGAALRTLGAVITDVDGEGIDHAVPAWVDIVCMEMVAAHPILENNQDKLFERTAGFVAHGLEMTADERAAAQAAAGEAKAWFADRLREVDVLLAPSSPYPAPLATQEEVDVGGGETVDVQLGGTSIFTRLVNMAGNPALAIPAGRASETGLPVGAQLIGRPGADEELLANGRVLEQAGGERFRPAIAPFPK